MEYFLSVAVMIAIFVILASSYNLVIGYGGLATVAHPIFFALGAYTAALLAIHAGLPAVLCVIAGAVVATLASVLLAASSLRVSGDYLLIASIGFQLGLLFERIVVVVDVGRVMLAVMDFHRLGVDVRLEGGEIKSERLEFQGHDRSSFRGLRCLRVILNGMRVRRTRQRAIGG